MTINRNLCDQDLVALGRNGIDSSRRAPLPQPGGRQGEDPES
jgi:hypothetical protein